MVDIKTIILKYSNIAKTETDDDEGKVIGVSPSYAFENNQVVKDKITGAKYVLLMDKNKYQTLDLKIEDGKKPIITQEDIDNSEDGYVPVLIHGFSAQLYQRDGKIHISCKAEKLEVIE